MKKKEACFAIALLLLILFIIIIICQKKNRGTMNNKFDDRYIGMSTEELSQEWIQFYDNYGNSRYPLSNTYTRWKCNNKIMIAVFKDNIIIDYVLFELNSNTVYSSILPEMSTFEILKDVKSNITPDRTYDIGSGVSIFSRFSNDGRIVIWTVDKETTIYRITDFKETHEHILYRLINGMMF